MDNNLTDPCATCGNTGRTIPVDGLRSLTCPDCLGASAPSPRRRSRRRSAARTVVVLASSRQHFELYRASVKPDVDLRYAFKPHDLRGLDGSVTVVELRGWRTGRSRSDVDGFQRGLQRLDGIGANFTFVDLNRL